MSDFAQVVLSVPRTVDLQTTLHELERAAAAAGCSMVRVGQDVYHVRPLQKVRRLSALERALHLFDRRRKAAR